MTTPYHIAKTNALMCQAMACNARVAAMTAGNAHALANGHREPAFTFSSFMEEAKKLGEISSTVSMHADHMQ